MVKLTSIVGLISALKEDQKRQDVRITRFISVSTVDEWNELITYLNQIGHLLRLSSFCKEDDCTPSYDDVMASVTQLTGQYTTILPISEDVRLLGSSHNYLSSLALVEASGNKRLYVPLFDSARELSRLETNDSRVGGHIFCIQSKAASGYRLEVYASDLTEIDTPISGYRNYLSLWENGSVTSNVSLRTKWANSLSERPATSAMTIYTSYLDVIKEQFSDADFLSLDMPPKPEWWAEAYSRLKNVESLRDLFTKTFPNCDDARQAVKVFWRKSSGFEKWLIWLWCRLSSTGYLKEVLENYGSFASFTDGVILHIFAKLESHPERTRLSSERRETLVALGIDEKPNRFWEMYGNLGCNEHRLLSLTDHSNKERSQIISIYGKELSGTNPNGKVKDLVEHVFPELLHYSLFDVYAENLNEKISCYFRSYIRNKMANIVDDSHQQLVAGFDHSELISIKARDPLVDAEYKENTLVLWVDGLSAEWLGLISFLLNERHSSLFKKIYLNRCHLPTTTEANKDFLQDKNSIKDDRLDVYAHDNTNYKYPDSIGRQIGIIEDIVELAASKLASHDRVIVASDHGSSRLAMLKYESQPLPEGCTAQKWGRCAQTDGRISFNDPNYIDDGGYLAMCNYSRFTVSGSPAGEVHGGATVEEWLVPTLVLSKKPFDARVELTLSSKSYRLQPGSSMIKVEVMTNAKIDNLKMSVGNQEVKGKQHGTKWTFEIELRPNPSHRVRFIANNLIVLEDTIEVRQGLKERMDI